MKYYSLRKKLIVWISVPILIIILTTLFSGYKTIKEEINEVFDANLINAARVLSKLSPQKIETNNRLDYRVKSSRFRHRYRNEIDFIIWKNNQVITSSIHHLKNHFENINEFLADDDRLFGFSNQNIGRIQYRSFTFSHPSEGIIIQVLENERTRNSLIIELLTVLLLPAFLLFFFIGVIIYFGIHLALKPIINLSTEVDQRSSDDLSKIEKKNLPKEILPLILAINRLLKRISKSLKTEREFTDNAAHELRTPLAAMKTQTQVLLRKNKLNEDNFKGLKNLESSINRANHLIEQLLFSARMQNYDYQMEKINLSELLNQNIVAINSSLNEKKIVTNFQIEKNITIIANADAINILLNNLLMNATKYTPKNGLISIILNKTGEMQIKNSGVGLSDKDKKEVFKRFVRKDKTGESGSGLGLSIAQSIAKAHSVSIKLKDNKPTGLIVTIQWKILT